METPSIVFDLDACAPDAGEEHQSTSFWDPWSHKRAFGSSFLKWEALKEKKPLTRAMPWIVTYLIWHDMTQTEYFTYKHRNIITATRATTNPLPANLIMGGRRNSLWEVSLLPLGLPLKSWVGSWLMAAPPPQMPPLLSSMPLFTQVMAIPWRNSTPGTNFRDFFKQPLGAQGKRKIATPKPNKVFLRSTTNFHSSQYNSCDVLMGTQEGLLSHWHCSVHSKLSTICIISMLIVRHGNCHKWHLCKRFLGSDFFFKN